MPRLFLAVSKVNADLACGHFFEDVEVLPQPEFGMKLANKMLHNAFGVEEDGTDGDGRHL